MSRSRRAAAHPMTILSIAALVAGAGYFLRYHVRDDLIPRNLGTVEPGHVYRAGRQSPAMLASIVRQHGIRTVVDLGAFADSSDQDRLTRNTLAALGVRRERFVLQGDGTGDPNRYVAALRVLANPASHPVLVMCAAGAQRTSGCVALFRTIVQNRPLESALQEAFDHRHDPGRNPHLIPYLQRWKDAIAESFRTGKPIPYDAEPVDPQRAKLADELSAQ